jgi:hypothetical protein
MLGDVCRGYRSSRPPLPREGGYREAPAAHPRRRRVSLTAGDRAAELRGVRKIHNTKFPIVRGCVK